jgi:uncharacterized membrane protein YdjX (TVP38/TMEM64 family)
MTETEKRPSARGVVRRWLPLIVIVGLMAAAYLVGLHKYLSLQTIGENYGQMQAFIGDNFLVSIALYALIYIAVIALSLPGGLIMTLTGGLLFGAALGASVTVMAATIGATIIFLVAKTSFGEALAAKAGPWLGKLRGGFQENAMSYMLFLRLVPAFPFVVVNLAPAFLGVATRTYVVGTLVGIIPGTVAYSLVGASLGAPLEAENKRFAACVAANGAESCTYSIDLKQLVSTELIFAGVALGVVALIPVAYGWFKKRSSSHAEA